MALIFSVSGFKPSATIMYLKNLIGLIPKKISQYIHEGHTSNLPKTNFRCSVGSSSVKEGTEIDSKSNPKNSSLMKR